MISSWKTTISDLNAEIERIKINIADHRFNASFAGDMQQAKTRLTEIESRARSVIETQRREAAALRRSLDLQMAELKEAVSETMCQIAEARQLRVARNRENHFFISEKMKKEKQDEKPEVSIDSIMEGGDR